MFLQRAARYAIGGAVVAAGLEVVTYPMWRQWCLTWGATRDEAAGPLPGDELLDNPSTLSTRAVTIGAPAEAIWPWLVQMGPGRGGAYTYDWIENLFGLDMHSASEIVPELQNLQVGDAQRLGRDGPVLRVAALEPQRSLVLRSDDGNWVWALVLVPHGESTRLISRNRMAVPGAGTAPQLLYTYLMEPGSLIMERKMLLGIRERAERARHERAREEIPADRWATAAL